MVPLEAVAHCSPCAVRRNADNVELNFGRDAVFTIAVADVRRSAVLEEVERVDGESAQLSKEHVANWLKYIERGHFHLDYEDLARGLQASDFLVDTAAVSTIARELARRILDSSKTPQQREQIIEVLPHENLLETVLRSALDQSGDIGVLTLISLLPPGLHGAVLTAYAPSIIRCNSLRLPHHEQHADASLSAVVAALSFRSLTCLELFHSHATEAVGPSDGICALPCELQLPDTCLFQENDARRFWDRMRDTWVYSQVDELVTNLLVVTKTFSKLQSLTLTCTVVGTQVTETLAYAFASGNLPLMSSFCIQNCSPDLNADPSSQTRLARSMILANKLQAEADREVQLGARGLLSNAGRTMQSLPTVPPTIALVLCEAYIHQLRHPESYRSDKYTLKVEVCKGSLKALHLYECNLTVQSIQAVAAIISRSPRLEALHVCQSVMVFLREPLLQGLVAQMACAANALAAQHAAVDAEAPPHPEGDAASPGSAVFRHVVPLGRAQQAIDDAAPAQKRLRMTVPGGSLRELHVLGFEYSAGLDDEAVLQGDSGSLQGSQQLLESLRKGPPESWDVLESAQNTAQGLLQQVIAGNPQLESLRLDSWDEEERRRNKSRFVLSGPVLESLASLSSLQCLGINLPTLSEAAGRAVARAITPALRMVVMHLDHDGPSSEEDAFMQLLAARLAIATALTSVEFPRATHACSSEPLFSALGHLTCLRRLRLACIGDAWAPDDPYRPQHLQALAKAVQQMPHMLQLELPLLSACDKPSMQALMSAVAQCSNLEALEIEACTDIQATPAIAPALQSLTKLRYLKIAHCKFVDAAGQGADLSDGLSALQHLETLVLKTSWIPDSLAIAVQKSVTTLPELRSLDIRCPPRTPLGYAQHIAQSMHRLSSLVSLQIQSLTVTIDALVASFSQMPHLQDLFLTLPHQLRFDNVVRLLRSMMNMPLTMLSLDYLQGCDTGYKMAHVAFILKELPYLMHVVLTAFVPQRSLHKRVTEGWEAVAGHIRCWFLVLVDGHGN